MRNLELAFTVHEKSCTQNVDAQIITGTELENYPRMHLLGTNGEGQGNVTGPNLLPWPHTCKHAL